MFEFIGQSISQYFTDGIKWNPIFILIVVWFTIQILKVIIDSIKIKEFSFTSIFAAWGFPSFHSWLATSVTTMVRLSEWFNSILFAICFAFSLLVAYDAMNVRFESWKQAKCINEIRSSLSAALLWGLNRDERLPLKERLWHTPIEVAWWIIISFILTFVLYYYLILK
jgi:acid phosphatase family membrane protein YuiD